MPRLEFVLVEVLHRNRHVLLLAARIGEAKVDELDLLVFNELQDVIRRHRHRGLSSLGWCRWCRRAGEQFPCQRIPAAVRILTVQDALKASIALRYARGYCILPHASNPNQTMDDIKETSAERARKM